MTEDARELSRAIGANVRRARADAGWTLDELASRSGASKGAVVGIEQGKANPSVGTLLKLADALRVPLTRLLERPTAARVRVVPAEEAVPLTTETGGRLTLLGAAAWIADSHVELWEWALEPDGSHRSEAHRAGTQEILHVRRGTLELAVGSERHRLGTGATAVFSADLPHAYANVGRGRAEMSMAVLEPAGALEPEAAGVRTTPRRSRRPRRSGGSASGSPGSPRTGARGRSRASTPA